MIASLTFTYGDKRRDIIEYKKNDSIDKLLRSHIDYNLFIFHNSPIAYVNEIRETRIHKDFNLNIGSLSGSYPAALKAALYFLKEQGVTKLLFFQDDVFSLTDSEDQIIDLIDYIKTTSDDYLNLEYYTDDAIDVLHGRETFNILKTDLQYFRKNGHWSFDDSPYYATMNYTLDRIYDEEYFSCPDIWSAEWYLKSKFDALDSKTLRPITNKQFFRRVNFLGKNDWNKDAEIAFLDKRFKIKK